MELTVISNLQTQNLNSTSASTTKGTTQSKGDFKGVLYSKQTQNTKQPDDSKQVQKQSIDNAQVGTKDDTSSMNDEQVNDDTKKKDKLSEDINQLMSMLASLLGTSSSNQNVNEINLNDLKNNIKAVDNKDSLLNTISVNNLKDLLAFISSSKNSISGANNTDISKLQQKFQDILNDITNDLKVNVDKGSDLSQTDLMTRISELIDESANNVQKTTPNDSKLITDIKDAMKNSLSNAINDKMNGTNIQALNLRPMALSSINSDSSKSTKSSEASADNISQNNSNSANNAKNDSKTDKFLNSILSSDSNQKNDKDSLINKAANFVGQFNNAANGDISIEPGSPTINKATLNEDIIKAIKFMDSNNIKELTVKIAPKDLGEMVIRLTMDNGVMKANISASNKEAFNILNANIQDISNKLSEQNMKIQSFSVGIHNGESFFSNENSKDNNQSKKGSKKISSIDGISTDNADLNDDLIEDGYVNTLA